MGKLLVKKVRKVEIYRNSLSQLEAQSGFRDLSIPFGLPKRIQHGSLFGPTDRNWRAIILALFLWRKQEKDKNEGPTNDLFWSKQCPSGLFIPRTVAETDSEFIQLLHHFIHSQRCKKVDRKIEKWCGLPLLASNAPFHIGRPSTNPSFSFLFFSCSIFPVIHKNKWMEIELHSTLIHTKLRQNNVKLV